jgi:uncharacterized SAM-binding protein YcdF (DUF218 family)
VTLYGAAKALLLPPGALIILGLTGLLVARRWPRAGWRLALAAFALLYALSTPFVASLLLLALGPREPVDVLQARAAQAIVIPGGGLRAHATEYGGETLGPLTLERVRYGARLARATGLPVLVTGGTAPGYRASEAEAMRDVLQREFGVAVRWVEANSRDTRDNARRTAELLLPQGVRRIVVVVHGFDVPRARAEYEDAGFEVIVAATRLARLSAERLADFLPSASALLGSYYATYEMAGLAVRPLRASQ